MQNKEKFSQVQFLSLLAFVVSVVLTGSLLALKLWYPTGIFNVLVLIGAFTTVASLLSLQSNRLESKLVEFETEVRKFYSRN